MGSCSIQKPDSQYHNISINVCIFDEIKNKINCKCLYENNEEKKTPHIGSEGSIF